MTNWLFYLIDLLAICGVIVLILNHFFPVTKWLIILSSVFILIEIIINIIYHINSGMH